MTEETNVLTEIPKEGAEAFPTDTGNENPTDSSPENDAGDGVDGGEGAGDGANDPGNTGGDGDAGDPPKTDPEKLPFHEHPRWIERNEQHKKALEDMQTQHETDMQTLRDDFGKATKENPEKIEMPDWFAGDEKQWKNLNNWVEGKMETAETNAKNKATSEQEAETKASDKLVKDATSYMNTEITAIESNKELNPTGEKIDPNKLIKFVMDNNLVDKQNRWNYKLGWKFMNNGKDPKQAIKNKKGLVGGMGGDHKGEKDEGNIPGSDDFKGTNRPW